MPLLFGGIGLMPVCEMTVIPSDLTSFLLSVSSARMKYNSFLIIGNSSPRCVCSNQSQSDGLENDAGNQGMMGNNQTQTTRPPA